MVGMILGEALQRRARLQKGVAQLQERLQACVLVQQGDEPLERADDLLIALDALCAELQALIVQIARTTATSTLPTGEATVEALARRDVLAVRRRTLRTAIRAAAAPPAGRADIRLVRQVDVAELQAQLDSLTQAHHDLETQLQAHNWSTPLGE